mgnify:CR=1 FL=1
MRDLYFLAFFYKNKEDRRLKLDTKKNYGYIYFIWEWTENLQTG